MRLLRCSLQVSSAAVVVLCLTVTPTIVTSVAAQETVHQVLLAGLGPGQTKGSATASVIIEEFSDFQCTYCGQFARDMLPRLTAAYVAPGKVRLIYRHFAILGADSEAAAEAAACAGAQGQFWPYHDRLFAVQGRLAFTRQNLLHMAQELHFDLTDFTACLETRRFTPHVRAETKAAMAYNGQVPGPEIRVREGERVRVVLTNALSEPTTIHWHGVEVPNPMDGVPGLTQPPVRPGEMFVCEFEARPAGTRWYHTHFQGHRQLDLGLAAPLIIAPAQPDPFPCDREYTLVLDDWATGLGRPLPSTREGTAGGRGGMGGMMGGMMGGAHTPAYDTMTINGKAYPATVPLTVRHGERVRLRLWSMRDTRGSSPQPLRKTRQTCASGTTEWATAARCSHILRVRRGSLCLRSAAA